MPTRDELVEVIVRQGQDPALLPPRDRYDRLAAGLVCQRIGYGSGGLRVTGFIYRPTHVPGRRPAIVYARGGNREFGSLPNHLPYSLLNYVEQGFVVLATQYRGNDGGEGREDFGGKDVQDVLSLVEVARSLDAVDAQNVFLLGYSRGGMMTLLALARGAPVRAAAVIGAPSDLLSDPRRDEMMPVYRELIPDFVGREEEALRRRSALAWAERIATPVLILHGRNDDRVIVRDAERLAERLYRAGRPHRLVIYEKAGHNLGSHALERDQRILAWFREHLRRTAARSEPDRTAAVP